MYVCWLTTASRVVTGHLAQVGVVLDYSHSSVYVRSVRIVGTASLHVFPIVFPPLLTDWVLRPVWDRVEREGESRHTLGTEELARDVEGLGADNDDLLAVEKLLGDDGGKTTKEMALAVDDDLERGTGVSDLYLQNVFAVDR